jgi:hypothetical protein
MANLENMLKWMTDRQGKVSYSMNQRLGPNSYDCSSAVYLALISGGFLPQHTIGNTDSLFGHLEKAGWKQVAPDATGNFPAQRGDIFIWGSRGASSGAAGHTGIFTDNQGTIIHCNYGYNGITSNNHDVIWTVNGCPPITIYRYGQTITAPVKPQAPTQAAGLKPLSGIFYPDRTLAVSKDTNPDDQASPALAHYQAGMAIYYDSYIMANGYAWISYIAASGARRYVAVGPDDGQIDTTWGRGFFN